MTRKQIFITLGVVAVLVIAVAGYYFLATPDTTIDAAATGPSFVVAPSDRTLGSSKAPITLIEYFAPSCPVCAAFNAQTFALLKQNYIDTGKVFYVMRVFPIRVDDGTAEKIARCLPADKYQPFIDLLFRNQSKWDVEFNTSFTEKDVHDALVQQGRIAGMSADQVDTCINDKAEDDRINKVAADGETRYHIDGTPTFILDGVPVGVGSLPSYADLQKFLDTELAAKKSAAR